MTATRNRIRHAFVPAPVALPKPSAEGHAVAVHAALAALVGQLRSTDERIVLAAATAILDLEKTRLRHARAVAGTQRPADTADDQPQEHDEPTAKDVVTEEPEPKETDTDRLRLRRFAERVYAQLPSESPVTFDDVYRQIDADFVASGLSVSGFLRAKRSRNHEPDDAPSLVG